jgi:gliding motility-associated-like protein
MNVVEYPLPLVDFTMSASLLDKRHNQLTCSIPIQSETHYLWDLGDGTTGAGASIQHTYSVSNGILEYLVSLSATSKYGCVANASKNIDVVPFIPNVFSPNGDGINDVFMPEIDLQIFDRSGVIFYNGTAGWDGRYNGKLVDQDTYFYLIHYTDKSQQVQTRKGYITLVR